MSSVATKPVVVKKASPIQFTPFSTRQLQVFNWWMPNSPKRYCRGIICDGAIRSGKTLIMSMSYVMWAMEKFDGQMFGIAGKTIQSLRRNLVTTLIQVMRVRGYVIREKRNENIVIISYKGKTNSFYLFGGRDESSQDLVQGFTAAGFFFDEVTLMPQTFVVQAMARCSVKGATQWFNCNPNSPYHWFKTEVLDKAEKLKYLHLHFSIYDNPSLTQERIDFYENTYTGVFYSRYVLGKWVIGDGAVFDNFNSTTMVFKPETVEQCTWKKTVISIDYGTSNATVFKKWSKSAVNIAEESNYGTKQIRINDWVCRDEYYYSGKGKDTSKQKTDDQYVRDLMEFVKYDCAEFDRKGNFIRYNWSKVAIILDPSALSFRTALRKKGFRTIRAKNNVLNGIRVMASLLNRGVMKYSEVCEETFKEFGSYVWDKKAAERGEEKPVKDNDHTMDADRYFAYTLLRERVGMQVWK